jgi:hypothetical protein
MQERHDGFKSLIMSIGQKWRAKGANGAYIRDFHYRDQPPGSFFPDAFFGYQTHYNSEIGKVNYDTHWHVYVKATGHFMMKLKCNTNHIGGEVPFDNSDGKLVNKIDTGLTSCWENRDRRSNSKSRDRGDSFHRMVRQRLDLELNLNTKGGTRKTKVSKIKYRKHHSYIRSRNRRRIVKSKSKSKSKRRQKK